MSARFQELDWQDTPLGPISLRRRREPALDVDVYEVKLGDEFLMSSLFTAAEVQLARLGLAPFATDDVGDLDVLVGGLGLGYTAAAALEDPRVRSLTVVEALAPVIDWHERRLLPDTAGLTADPRTRLVHGDFFALVAGSPGSDNDDRTRIDQRYHAVLLDIDHTPQHVLHPRHAAFYTAEGLQDLRRHLLPGGVFALWSDDPPDEDFTRILAGGFPSVASHVVTFANPLTGGTSANTVYVAAL